MGWRRSDPSWPYSVDFPKLEGKGVFKPKAATVATFSSQSTLHEFFINSIILCLRP